MTENKTTNYLNSLLYTDGSCCFNGDFKINTLEDYYEAIMIVPGSEKKEISITASNNLLDVVSSNASYPYKYQIKLYKTVDIEKISSSLDKGVLKIKLPKLKAQVADRIRIPVS